MQHEDNSEDSYNDFNPIHCQKGHDTKTLQLHNDGENFTLNSTITEYPMASVQSVTDCFRIGKSINQFRHLCKPSSPPSGAIESSDPTYSSIDSLNTDEDYTALEETPQDTEPNIDQNDMNTNDDEDNRISEVNYYADHYRLCKAKAAHGKIFGKIDASTAKKALTATEAPWTQSL